MSASTLGWLGAHAGKDRLDGVEVAAGAWPHFDHIVAGHRLQVIGRARGDHPAVVDDDDVAGELVGFLEVLGGEQHIGAVGDERPDGVPQLEAASRVEAGGRFVEEEQLGAAHEAGAKVEAPPHATRIVANEAVTGVGEAESFEHVVRRGLGVGSAPSPKRRPTITRFSRPVIVGSTDAYWPARPMILRTSFGCWRTSIPATVSVPLSGRSNVATALMNVVLPAPLGPSSAVSRPVSAVRSNPASAWTSPKCLVSPRASMIGAMIAFRSVRRGPGATLASSNVCAVLCRREVRRVDAVGDDHRLARVVPLRAANISVFADTGGRGP